MPAEDRRLTRNLYCGKMFWLASRPVMRPPTRYSWLSHCATPVLTVTSGTVAQFGTAAELYCT